MKNKIIYNIFVIFLISGCTLSPKIKPLDENVISNEFKNNNSDNKEIDISMAKPHWEDLVRNETLKKVVSLAIENNKDLKIAILNVQAAQASYRISRADLFPNVSLNTNLNRSNSTTNNINQTYSVNASASYELDLFGKVRSLKDNALNSFLSTSYATNATKISLISQTILSWVTLAASQEQLKLSQEILEIDKKSYELEYKKYLLGMSSQIEVLDAKTTLNNSEISVVNYKNQLEQNKNALELIISQQLTDDLIPNNFENHKEWLMLVESGLSSKILLSRPDIMEAEYNLKAKNANIGAARAAFFPSISLTGTAGNSSSSLDNLFNQGFNVWSFVPSISIPIFSGGANIANLDYSNVQKDIAIQEYEKAIQNAFKEVNDALIVRKNINFQIKNQEELVKNSEKSYNIILNSYKIGINSFLNVLTSQRTLISAKQTLIENYLLELTNRINLYASFGGNEKIENL